MNLEEIRQVIELMKENDLAEFEVEEQGFRIALKRRAAVEPPGVVVATPPAVAPVPPARETSASAPSPSPEDPEAGWIEIKAPIVGTFYRAPSPDAEPFVSVGQPVEEDTVVAIIEAMKVMNEIKAEVRGIVRRVCVENATPVQYGQPLFKVEPV
jgi:acetyl-CoA carboxylase biotin carboxyl carrier protein